MGYKLYCKDYENIENYEKALKDNFKGWCCHHRLQTHNSDGERRLVNISAAELLALGMYYNRPAEELIFLTESEHHSLHNKGEKHPLYGKHHSEQSRNKMSESKKNMSEATRKKMGEAKKGNTNVRGRRWFNNGKICIRAKECPPGFVPGRLRK